MKSVKSVEQSRDEATELCLFVENDSRCYHNYLVPAFKNQQRHYDRNLKKGVESNFDLTVLLFTHTMKLCAQEYCRQHGSPTVKWHEVFDVLTRIYAARHFAEYFVAEYNAGNRWEI
jgi:hypothetical protein